MHGGDSKLIPLDFTYVVYDSTSLFSEFMAFVTFLPIILLIALAASFAVRREIETGYFGAGCLVSTCLNSILKKIVKEPRPIGSAKKGFGMPSDHSQMMSFLGVYMLLWLMFKGNFDTRYVKPCLSLVTIGMMVCVPISRVVLGVHSVKQVLCGSVIGASLALLWYGLAAVLIRRFVFPLIEDSWLGRFFWLKDSSQIDNVLKIEYLHSRRLRGLDKKYG